MADLGEILEERRTVEGDGSGHENGSDSVRRSSSRRKRSRKRRNSGESQGSAQPSSNGRVHEKRRGEDVSDEQNVQPQPDSQRQDTPLIQEDHQAQFYAAYRKVADEYDKEFFKKYDEDLNTTLIFAGLFSAVTSAFIIEVNSQLQPDPGDETAALLRVLIYEINSSAFGGNVPTLPRWTGPPPTIVHVQAILFASLAVSLLSAFLAMLGKQWLNRYESTDMRGSAEERSHNRQRKLDGIVTWYFNHVMESLPLMLQIALFLLGCALSRYFWDINITVASVVAGFTSFGLVFYLFITVAGAVFESCPYQTPGSLILRHLGPKAWIIIRSTPSALTKAFEHSKVTATIAINTEVYHPWWSRSKIIPFFGDLILELPPALATDIYHLGRAAVQMLPTLRTLSQQMTLLDFRCISWTLQTSLDKPIHLTALKRLGTMTELTGLDPTLVTDCFNVFAACIGLSNNKAVVIQGLDQLAMVSVGCFFTTFHHLWITDPTSSVLAELLRRYDRAFPFRTDFNGLPFYHTIMIIHALVHHPRNLHHFQWDDYRPSSQEYIQFARRMVKGAQVGYQRMERRKVPRLILRFALHSLSLEPPPPTSVVADCLTIVAIDLGCDVSDVLTLDDSTRPMQILGLITLKFETMAEVPTADRFLVRRSKQKAIATLLPYALRLEQAGQQEVVDAISRVAGTLGLVFDWHRIRVHIIAVFDESSPPSLNRAIALISPHIPWHFWKDTKTTICRWAAAAEAVPHSEEVCQNVVDILLWTSEDTFLLPYIPVNTWAWLKKEPRLPPVCKGRSDGSYGRVVTYVRGLGDIEILKSYLLLVWSEWDPLSHDGLKEMEVSIREDFGGIGMWCHRQDLVNHLDHVQKQLDRGLEYFERHLLGIGELGIQQRKEQYEHLRDVLLEVDKSSTETLTQSHTTFTCAVPLPLP